MMDLYRLLLEERIRQAKAVAAHRPTPDHLAAYGRAIMAQWAANPSPSLESEAAMQQRVLRLIAHYVDAMRPYEGHEQTRH
jgi:hypothetical protein